MSHDTISPRRPLAPLLFRIALVAVALIMVASVVLQRITLSGYYQIIPGSARAVGPLISVSGMPSTTRAADIYLVDVYVTPLTAWGWLTAPLHRPHETFQMSDYLAPGVPDSEFATQGYLDMDLSKRAAAIAALRALGWHLTVTPVGANIYAVLGKSLAWRAGLRVADRIVSVDAITVHTTCDLIRYTHPLAPGRLVHLGVQTAHVSSVGRITYGTTHTVALHTAALGNWAGPADCPGAPIAARSSLGLEVTNAISAPLPATIAVSTDNIGGPSAGLAMTLALIDHLSATKITGRAHVAVTGTIDQWGNVGEVGGVAEKTAAAMAAGATDFIVPASQVGEATPVAGSRLHVWGVSTVREALADLTKLSGVTIHPLTQPNSRPLNS